MEVTVVGALGPWAAAWDELVDALPVPTPFLRSWWLAHASGPRPAYVLVLDRGELVGGLALEVRRRVAGVPLYRPASAGKLCPDHLDVLRRPGREDDVAAALHGWTTGHDWVLDADGIVDGALLPRVFPGARVTADDVAPWDELPASGEEYLAQRSGNARRELRRTLRRLADAGVTHERLSAVADGLDAFERLHRARGDRDQLLRELPRLRPALEAGAARGEVHVDVLRNADGIVAVLIAFDVGGAVRAYQNARELDAAAQGTGSVLIYHLARLACADGRGELDLLRGAEPYKDRFVSRRRTLWRVRAAHGIRGRVLLAALETLRALRRRVSGTGGG